MHRTPPCHDDNLLGKSERFDLVMGDINQRQLELVMNLLELAAQLPFEVRVNHRQRLVEQDRRHIGTYQTPPQGDFLFRVCSQARRTLVQLPAHLEHLCNLADTFVDLRSWHLSVAQRKGEVFCDGHGVVNHRELKHLRNVARLGGVPSHITAIKFHASLRWGQQARHHVKQRGFSAARGSQQRVGTAVFKRHLQRQQRVVTVLLRVGPVRVGQVQFNSGHVSGLPRAREPEAVFPGRQTGRPRKR